MVHGTIALLFIAIMLAHVYIGMSGVEGAFAGMREGRSTSIEHGSNAGSVSSANSRAFERDRSRIGAKFVHLSGNR